MISRVRSAVADFSARYGKLPLTGANARIDDLLMCTGCLDRRFTVRIGAQPPTSLTAGAAWTHAYGVWAATGGASQGGRARIICVASNPSIPSAAAGGNYRLDGETNLAPGVNVISAVIPNLTGTEAKALSAAIDGDSLSAATSTAGDDAGRVAYAAPDRAGLTTAYIYIDKQ